MNIIFNRLVRLTGKDNFKKIKDTKIIIFGVGGVGSWCAESLIRSGINFLTIVDSDTVCMTNINRQLQATFSTVGEVKVEALKKRLLDINPESNITAINKKYNCETKKYFNLSDYDYVIDAIDTLSCKIDLIEHALSSKTKFYSSMGAASKIDPSRVIVANIWKTHGCPLARNVRNRLKKRGIRKKFLCVFSDEVLPVYNNNIEFDTSTCNCSKKDNCEEMLVKYSSNKQINGSITHITGIFGFNLAGLVIKDIMK